MSKRRREHVAWWEIRDDEDGDPPYWYGYCEGDKDGDRLNDAEPLILDPLTFPIGTRIDIEEPEDSVFYDRLFADRGTPASVERYYRDRASADLLEACKYALDMLAGTVGSETVAERLAGIGGLYAQTLLTQAITKAMPPVVKNTE